MPERVTRQQRAKLENVAEREIMRYADDHYMWHKHIHNVELDAMQILKCIEMDQHANTVDCSCRRTGKTAIKELYNLKELATKQDQELGIVSPREAQSLVNLGYQMDAIRRSEILEAYIAFESGRRKMADTYFKFANRSIARSYGIMAQVDGGDLTMASLEEVDDMPPERLYSRFLLMMGSTRRLGASKDSENKPQIRITGVFKGADTLSGMVDSGDYHLLPTINVHLGIEMGILQPDFMVQMRNQLPAEEYIRQLLCKNISARNFIWTKWVRQGIHTGLRAGVRLVEPVPEETYKKRGLISFGYDHAGHGETPQSSRYALVVTEQLGNFVCFIYARTWPATTDEKIVRQDLLSIWRYFRPDEANGDAFGIGLLTELNDNLYNTGLSEINRLAIADGTSSASTWTEWAFSPLRFEGMVKHQMASALRSAFSSQHTALPYIDDEPEGDPAIDDMRQLQRQITNIRAEPTSKAYQSYSMINKKLGDDLFDAAMAAVWGLVTRGMAAAQTVVTSVTTTREQLLGAPSERLPSESYMQ